jgi:hypothetical protein
LTIPQIFAIIISEKEKEITKMKINIEDKRVKFSAVPAGGVFVYNGDVYIALIRDYNDTDENETFNAVDLDNGSVINISDNDTVTYYANAALNL